MERDAWVADPAVAWQILLEADLEQVPDVAVLQSRVDALNTTLGSPTSEVVSSSDPVVLRSRMSQGSSVAVAVGISDRHLVISAQHHYLDGLALLTVLGSVTDSTVRSSARGTAGRDVVAPGLRTLLQRLGEVVFTPPARIARARTHASKDRTAPDVFARVSVPRSVVPADLVHAAVAATGAFNTRAGARRRRTAIAIGVSQVDGASAGLGDHSALLRLRDLEGRSREEVARLVREAPLQPAPVPSGTGVLIRVATKVALRLFGRRLGSTLLVSHLGSVTAPRGLVSSLSFHPVTGGGSGVSVGAVELGGTTTLSARARAHQHTPESLAALLDDVVAGLPS
ncbi:hypothetical protein ASD66_09760 [Nocardioides sp. Root151]|nr:hypothetical protein ASD66_09760 [Nocardioides sp. Root151]